MRGQFFAVINLNKNNVLLYGLGILVLLIVGVFLIVSFANFLVSDSNNVEEIQYNEVLKKQWYGQHNDDFPEFFVAGGVNYDHNILSHHGIENVLPASVNHFNDIGIYAVGSKIKNVNFSEAEREVYVELKKNHESYQLVTFGKETLGEGPITYIFLDADTNSVLGSEEDYIYSTPVQFTLIKEGEEYTANNELGNFVIADSSTVPILAKTDIYSEEIIPEDELCMYVFGGEVVTIQQRKNLTRVYFNESEGYQFISIDKNYFEKGENVIKFIRESDLREFHQENVMIGIN
ncbi:hypothetical protein PRVXH_001543 [Proteinivorax hydrogeniformans]|uniref:Uncharacterized protein n=1 Tax=Proteinivorax hydrogeniformans TaxID=1826727 RepID=A0AAU8HR86_9FIRM